MNDQHISIPDQYRELLDKYYNDEASAAELELLFHFFGETQLQERLHKWMEEKWTVQSEGFQLPIAHSQVLLSNIQEQLGWLTPDTAVRKPVIVRMSFARKLAAAAILICICFSAVFLLQRRAISAELVKIEQPAGKRSVYTLPDGSRVWLNSGSSMQYQADFLENRAIILNGEGYFEVVSKAHTPFTVQAGTTHTIVLGTSFNINAYDTASITIAVNSGKIRVEGTGRQSVILMAGRQLTTRSLQQPVLAATDYTVPAWTENRLVFRNTPFSEVAEKLEQWYHKKLIIENTTLLQCGVNGEYKDATLEEVMRTLQFSLGFTYTVEHDSILIKGGRCDTAAAHRSP